MSCQDWGVPLLEIWIKKIIESKITSIIVNTHYLSEQVNDYVKNSIYKDCITIKHEPILLGTAGTLIKNIDLLNGFDVLVAHADNYFLEDLSGLINAHHLRPPCCDMTMMTFVTDSPDQCGIVHTDESGVVIDFYEKQQNPPGNVANGAIYIFSPKLMKELNSLIGLRDISTELIPKLVGRIFEYRTHKPFIDIGTIYNYEKANLRL